MYARVFVVNTLVAISARSLRQPTGCPSPKIRPARIVLILACANRIPDGAGTVSPGKETLLESTNAVLHYDRDNHLFFL